MSEEIKCHCGESLHYQNEETKRVVEMLVDQFGEFQRVTVGGFGTWKVQRHYVALHGLKSKELPYLGFEKIA